MASEKQTGVCKGCGSALGNTGAPIWEDFCPNKDCTFDRDQFSAMYWKNRESFKRDQMVRDAAFEMLEALLPLPTHWLEEGVLVDARTDELRIEMRIVGTTYEAQILVSDLRAARAAIARATGEQP